ncbi:hypothetical protein BD289DRAFT_368562 [Coniella lustricola]|uniref:DnaJ domain-containing protein n=1 Tax=Coniella lustricola TaxID=2025994 RepID=A0A2T3A826_9PEZI|nr:hypothetical protein BD289DRAFT_368562 [Coniella lustricola]
MGAQQSSSGRNSPGAAGESAARKTCYYEVLGVERTVEDAEIRKAYKKKALELHPDRNYNDEENATRKFAEVQTAYEVLSDPQERAWYDSHRDAILRGDADDADADTGPQSHYNVRLTTTDEIMTLIGRFNSRVPFDDSPSGFFAILDIFFGQLAAEETAACDWEDLVPAQYPPFGAANDDHESVPKPFYAVWSNFSTKKSFSWKDKWRLSDAPDRRVRRAMEKENKKARDDAIRDFNDAVRSLVAFVKKRDPRYIPNTQSEAERQKFLRDSAATQAARARAANEEKMKGKEFVVADWAQSRGDEEAEYNDEFATSSDESEVEQIECVVCNKLFKSEKQYEAHEKSKKHAKAIQQLRRQMKKEGRDLDLDLHATEPPAPTHLRSDDSDVSTKDENQDKVPSPTTPIEAAETEDVSGHSSSTDTVDDEYAPREVVENRLASKTTTSREGTSEGEKGSEKLGLESQISKLVLDDDEHSAPKKLGKAKAKRAKKSAQAQAQAQDISCNDCNQTFESRTQLFKHIRDEDHAQLKSATQPPLPKHVGKKGKKSKR